MDWLEHAKTIYLVVITLLGTGALCLGGWCIYHGIYEDDQHD